MIVLYRVMCDCVIQGDVLHRVMCDCAIQGDV